MIEKHFNNRHSFLLLMFYVDASIKNGNKNIFPELAFNDVFVFDFFYFSGSNFYRMNNSAIHLNLMACLEVNTIWNPTKNISGQNFCVEGVHIKVVHNRNMNKPAFFEIPV